MGDLETDRPPGPCSLTAGIPPKLSLVTATLLGVNEFESSTKLMWPFRSKAPEAVAEVAHDGVTARYSKEVDAWEFVVESIEFIQEGRDFDSQSVTLARRAIPLIQSLEEDMGEAVKAALEEWRGTVHLDSAAIVLVDLTEFGPAQRLTVTFGGDDSWGDLAVDITVENGCIVEVEGGD